MMDIQRIRSEVARAAAAFALIETYPTAEGGVYVKAGFQTSAGKGYVVVIQFAEYPYRMPQVYVTKPAIHTGAPHRYNAGNLCYLHPNMWNPGRHDLLFVLEHIAKWLNKYEVWLVKSRWPGAGMDH
jgi:hypothetical protein